MTRHSFRGEGQASNGAARVVTREWWLWRRGKEGIGSPWAGAMVSGPAMAPAAWPAAGTAAATTQDEMRWRQLDSGVSAVSFGFVATAILVSMFLAMAILEHFLRAPAPARGMGVGMGMGPPFAPSPPRGGILLRLRCLLLRRHGAGGGETGFPGSDLEAARKLDGRASPEMPVYAKGVSVLMPGQDVPTFIAHPAPAPCPPERIQWPSHQPTPFFGSS